MKKITHFIKFFIGVNIVILSAILVAFTMVSFAYYYFYLKQDPATYFSWWWGNISSIDIIKYKYYLIGFEIALLVVGIVYISKENKKVA